MLLGFRQCVACYGRVLLNTNTSDPLCQKTLETEVPLRTFTVPWLYSQGYKSRTVLQNSGAWPCGIEAVCFTCLQQHHQLVHSNALQETRVNNWHDQSSGPLRSMWRGFPPGNQVSKWYHQSSGPLIHARGCWSERSCKANLSRICSRNALIQSQDYIRGGAVSIDKPPTYHHLVGNRS